MRLTLFFTRGVSLAAWDSSGLLERETALYRRLAEQGWEVGFVTYGGREDLAFADRLAPIRVLPNRWNLPARAYGLLLPWLHRAWLGGTDALKTNQADGGWEALRTARVWQKHPHRPAAAFPTSPPWSGCTARIRPRPRGAAGWRRRFSPGPTGWS